MAKKWNLEKPRRKKQRSEQDNITITINYGIYKKLSQIKLDEDLRTFDEVLEFLLNGDRE